MERKDDFLSSCTKWPAILPLSSLSLELPGALASQEVSYHQPNSRSPSGLGQVLPLLWNLLGLYRNHSFYMYLVLMLTGSLGKSFCCVWSGFFILSGQADQTQGRRAGCAQRRERSGGAWGSNNYSEKERVERKEGREKRGGGAREGRGEPAQSTYRTKYSPGTANNWGLSQQISPVIS